MNIKICESCKGEGRVQKHDRDSWEWVKCSSCNGTGRVKTRSYSYTVPFDADVNLIRKVDDEIFELIRKLEREC